MLLFARIKNYKKYFVSAINTAHLAKRLCINGFAIAGIYVNAISSKAVGSMFYVHILKRYLFPVCMYANTGIQFPTDACFETGISI